ncbi:YceO family protein [Enterobacter ludwigii]|nr:YceO family protein [Enterobacter ludwigii]UOY72265.1 YceO family protein [Enterobacter ludwigii]
MRRIVNFLMNNIREHFMLYILLWTLLAIIDFVYIVFY